MSRHTLEDGTVVGWDHPMLTFFAQRLDESEEVAIESLGDRPREFEGGTSTTWMTSTAAVALGVQLIEAGNRAAMRPRR